MERITLSRGKGWRLPPNAVIVDRRTKWGNPYKVMAIPGGRWGVFMAMPPTADPEQASAIRTAIIANGRSPAKLIAAGNDKAEALNFALALYELYAILYLSPFLPELNGRDLACWCKPPAPCHADVLIKLVQNQ